MYDYQHLSRYRPTQQQEIAVENGNDQQPESQPVRRWRTRLREALAALWPRQHDHAERDDQGRRW